MAKKKTKKKRQSKNKPVTAKVKKSLKNKLSGNRWKFGAAAVAVLLVVAFASPFISGFFVASDSGTTELEGLWLTIITDDSCSVCDYSDGTAFFENYIPGLNIREVSYTSTEGTNLIKTMNISAVPAFVFTDEITQTDIYEQISMYFTQFGDKYIIMPIWITRLVDLDAPDNVVNFVKESQSVGTSEQTVIAYLFNNIPNVVLDDYLSTSATGQQLLSTYGASAPTFIFEEIPETSSMVDDLNDYFSGQAIPDGCTKTQSEVVFDNIGGMDVLQIDSTFTDAYTKSDKPKLEFFVMSFCPYGNLAEDIIEPIFDLMGDKVDIEPHYIASVDPTSEDGYRALHGPQELHQNVREVCVFNHFGEQAYWDFVSDVNIECSSSNADTCWEPVAEALGLDVDAIKTCEQDEMSDLIDADIALTTSYGVTGSPTMIINGQRYSGQRTSENLKDAICCAFNTQPEECSQTLSETTQGATGSC